MTFRADRYPADWRTISARVRERAGQRCERCKAPNARVIMRGEGRDAGTYMLERGEVFDAETGEERGLARGSEYDGRMVRVVLTVAHLDHDEQNNAETNLRALCQRCHLAHDRADNAKRRAANRRGRRAAGELPGVRS